MITLSNSAVQQASIQTFITKQDKAQALQAILQSEQSIQADLDGGTNKSLIINFIQQKLRCVPVMPIISASDFYDVGILKATEYSENEHRSFIRCTYELLSVDRLRSFLQPL